MCRMRGTVLPDALGPVTSGDRIRLWEFAFRQSKRIPGHLCAAALVSLVFPWLTWGLAESQDLASKGFVCLRSVSENMYKPTGKVTFKKNYIASGFTNLYKPKGKHAFCLILIIWVLENDHKPNENFILWVSHDDFGFGIEASFGRPMG